MNEGCWGFRSSGRVDGGVDISGLMEGVGVSG